MRALRRGSWGTPFCMEQARWVPLLTRSLFEGPFGLVVFVVGLYMPWFISTLSKEGALSLGDNFPSFM